MNKRSIRYKRPEWKNWVWVKIDEDEVNSYVAKLEAEGYVVEK